MKGLILKDLLMLKNQMKSLLVVIVFLIIIMTMQNDASFISFLIPFYIVMLVVSTFSYDELNNWNLFCNTLPFSRKDIVKSKYYLFIIGLLFALAIGIIISMIVHYTDNSASFLNLFSSTAGALAGITVALSLMIPFFYKFGVQKGRLLLFVLIAVISALFGFLLTYLQKNNINIMGIINKLGNLNTWLLIGLAIIILFIILYISYLFSYNIYKKQEF